MLTKEELAIKLSPIPAVWLTLEERMCLLKYAGLSKGEMVEVGTAWGGSACIMILGSYKQYLSSIDPMEPPLCQVDGWDITADKVRSVVKEVLGPEYSRWELYTVTSQMAAETFAENGDRFGLVFIDGDHSYEAVHQDVTLWLPLIQRHGFLILHDSRRDPRQPEDSNLGGYLGPTQVAQELTGDKRVKLIETVYSMTIWEVQ